MKTLLILFASFFWLSASFAQSPNDSAPPFDEQFLEDVKKEDDADPDRFYQELINMLFTLGLLIGLLILASWLFKRMMVTRSLQLNKTSSIKILDTRSLTPKTHIYILEIEGRKMIIADSVNGVTYLSDGMVTPNFKKFMEEDKK